MLSRKQIEDIIHVRLPEADIETHLLDLTPDKIDAETLDTFMSVISETLVEEASTFDCTGTGGSGLPHFNTSTAASFVLAAQGLKVIKCGNVGISGRSGSFDFLRALGFPEHLPVALVPALFRENGLTFLFAPQFYPGLLKLSPIRKALGVRTIFNFIGPLLNPARPQYRVLGVSDPAVQRLVSQYLTRSTYSTRALVVRGEDGMDEFITNGATHLFTVSKDSMIPGEFLPAFGENGSAHNGDLDARQNVRIFKQIINGEDMKSQYYNMICLNAGAAFFVSGRAASIEDGVKLAADVLASGAVREKFEACRRSYGKYLA